LDLEDVTETFSDENREERMKEEVRIRKAIRLPRSGEIELS